MPSKVDFGALQSVGQEKTFLVISSSHLSLAQEVKLLEILRKHTDSIDWIITGIKGISILVLFSVLLDCERAKV